MEINLKEDNLESPTFGIYDIPGEPALVINGVPPVHTKDADSLVLCKTASDINSKNNVCFGEWLEGRDVRKLFGRKLYNGKVAKFDKDSGWYRVIYEDGDFEDLELHELQQVLLPLDVTIPLKTLASKVVKRALKHDRVSGKSATNPKITVCKKV